MKSFILRHRRTFIGIYHFVVFVFSVVTAYLLRFDFSIPTEEVLRLQQAVCIAVAVKLPIFLWARIHTGWWRFLDISELIRISLVNVLASIGFTLLTLLFIGPHFPRSVYLIDLLLSFLLTAGARFAVHFYNEAVGELSRSQGKGVLIYGAGAAGILLLREIRSRADLSYNVIGFIDDDPRKKNKGIMGVKVLGMGRDVAAIIDRSRKRSTRVEEVVIAMPSATGHQMREALSHCRVAGVQCKTIPGLGEILQGKVLSAQIRDIAPTDLLARAPVRLEEARISEDIVGRTILVTGAAGSIGSELCQQLARYKPGKLIAFDQAESELYKIELMLRKRFRDVNIEAEIGDIRDLERVNRLIRYHAVDSVFHAAAYKHVPMMEANVLEAIKNNVLGTWNVAKAAYHNGVANFLMISSDKAVNPTNIMGATKRAAELIVSGMQSENFGNCTRFVSVRFGNVLGSNGSVVPLFRSQIEEGGPVTVTHPEVRRYFMTVREAVQLVLQASTMGKGAEVFVLDMGEPIRIIDLAKNMIRLAGLLEDEIEIRFVGLRPGEKLYEELITEGEDVLPTYHEKIKILRGQPVQRSVIDSWLSELNALLKTGDEHALIFHLQEMVPEFQPDQRWLVSVSDPPVLARTRAG